MNGHPINNKQSIAFRQELYLKVKQFMSMHPGASKKAIAKALHSSTSTVAYAYMRCRNEGIR